MESSYNLASLEVVSNTTMGTAQRNISIPIMQTTNDTINNNEHDSSNQIYDFEEFISDQLLADFMAAFIWLMPVLCLLAVTFCVLNAIVYSQQRAARFAWYLVAVDLGDGLCSLVELLHSFTFFAVRSDAYLHLVVKWYMAKYFAASCRRAAVCLNAFASLERFLAIAFPLKSVRLCGKPSLIIASVFALSLGTHIYFVLEFEVVSKGDGGWNLAHTTLRKNHADAFILWSTVASAVFAYTPLVAIILLNSVLLVFLRRHAASLQNVRRARGVTRSRTSEECDDVSSGSSLSNGKTVACNTTTDGSATTGTGDTSKRKRENQTTKMVMVFSTVFLMMALPRMLNSTARSLFDDYGPKGKEKNLYSAVGLLAQLTSHLTETALFWVSFLYSRQFRRSVMRLPVARWLCGPYLAKTSLAGSSATSGDVSTSTRGAVWSTSESLTRGD